MNLKSVWKKKRKVMRHYNIVASIYDRQYKEEQDAKIRAALESLHLEKNDLILDAGCGTGILLDHLRNSAHTIVGVDIAVKALRRASKRSGCSPKVNLVQADADYMPFPDGTFDKTFAVTLIQNMPNPEATLREIKRVSKPNAAIIVTGLKKTYSLEAFLKTLYRAGLEAKAVKSEEHLKGYVAICLKKKAARTLRSAETHSDDSRFKMRNCG
ncbi:MAG: methylase involved in ubiquinone/menaquinone biosynthesis [Candidatus Bathyarchaeota archaeon B26-2]|nr:MAG: methylase involved in ubiquinone/menaquinone biosynthesis [Candidatus Bathyarchaeota archaeon B26-2]